MRKARSILGVVLATSLVGGCNWIFDIERREVPPLVLGDAGAGWQPPCGEAQSKPTACGGVEVDVCSDAKHCGVCGHVCEDSPYVQCLRGACHDHRDPGQWTMGELPGCVPNADATAMEDENTGLIWEGAGNAEVDAAGSAAEDHCAQLSADGVGGFRDWALPTRIELSTLANFEFDLHSPYNACRAHYPSGAPTSGWYCGRSRAVSDRSWRHLLRIPDGAVVIMPPSLARRCRPRCVHATRPNVPDRFVQDSSFIYDRATDLLWMRLPARRDDDGGQPEKFRLTEAFAKCSSLEPLGSWRVPWLKELASIVDERRATSIYDVFPAGGPDDFWSKNYSRTDLTLQYVMDFVDGGFAAFANGEEQTSSLRCVRTGRLAR
ncbi:MAG: DUF1566 domain-containing protein [Deltaproteobacteria bacterium]|nr:DUF1566 domain-containing protein [Deltaproteobacteria bacterium]